MYESMEELFNSARDPVTGKPIDNNTRLVRENDETLALTLHGHKIIYYHSDGSITLDSCGYRTRTTKERINEYTPFMIYQENFIWYVRLENKDEIFEDKMVLCPDGKNGYIPIIENQETIYDASTEIIKDIDKYAKKFAEALPVGQPGSGDCWYCLMVTEDMQSWGDASGEHGHLENHIYEDYFVSSLLLNAVREARWTDFRITISGIFKGTDRAIDSSDRSAVKRAIKNYIIKRLVHNHCPA